MEFATVHHASRSRVLRLPRLDERMEARIGVRDAELGTDRPESGTVLILVGVLAGAAVGALLAKARRAKA